jgi:hypothetical protein
MFITLSTRQDASVACLILQPCFPVALCCRLRVCGTRVAVAQVTSLLEVVKEHRHVYKLQGL